MLCTDKFQDVCVAGHKLFLLQRNSPQLLNWEEYGLSITIPHDAVQQSDTVEVAITALVGGEFILPEDTVLVSAVYALSVSKPLLKPVQLEIQHCVSIEKTAHSNYLSFATAPIDQPPYQFQPVNVGYFLLVINMEIYLSLDSLYGQLLKRNSDDAAIYKVLQPVVT